MENDLEKMKPKILKILKKHGVERAGIFGSYARGEEKEDSDLDLLIEVNGKEFSLIDLIGLEMELKKAIKKKVDLITYKGISPYLKDRIIKEEVRII